MRKPLALFGTAALMLPTAVPAALATWAMRTWELTRGAKEKAESAKEIGPSVKPTGSFTWILGNETGGDQIRIVAEEALQVEPTNSERSK